MRIVSLPCSRLVRRFVSREYGTAPAVSLLKSDPLYDVLLTQRGLGYGIADADFSETVSFELLDHLADHVEASPQLAATALHRFVVYTMMRFVWTLGLAKVEATKALRMFFAMYDIAEDDYGHETAYRLFQRFASAAERKKLRKCRNAPPPAVVHFSGKGGTAPVGGLPPSDAELTAVFERVRDGLLAVRPWTGRNELRQIEVYVWLRVGRRHYATLMPRFGMGKSQVYYSSKRVQGFLDTDSILAELLRNALQPGSVLPLAA